MNTIKITVEKEEEGTPLLTFLADHIGISRKKTKALIDSRNVFINRKRVWMAKHKVKDGDYIEALTPDATESKRQKTDILYEDANYIIVNKGSGIVSNGENSLESALRIELNMPDLHCVHRLDKDTSGCLLVARSNAVLGRTIPVFKERKVEKSYHAIVSGLVDPAQQTIKDDIDGKPAVTSIKALDSNREASHVSVQIKTGRTHQIRKHLASIQHYVLGDRYYGTGRRSTDKTIQVGRQMLHASSFKFEDPQSGKLIKTRAPLPHDFRRCLKLFRLT